MTSAIEIKTPTYVASLVCLKVTLPAFLKG